MRAREAQQQQELERDEEQIGQVDVELLRFLGIIPPEGRVNWKKEGF
jgi:hypothetical protein